VLSCSRFDGILDRLTFALASAMVKTIVYGIREKSVFNRCASRLASVMEVILG